MGRVGDLLLTDCWIRAEYTFCSVRARSCVDVVFDPGCVTLGLVPPKTLMGIYAHSGQEGRIPLAFTQQYCRDLYCRDLLPTSVVLKLICGSASTPYWIWTSGLFHAVMVGAPSVWGSFKSFRRFDEGWNYRKWKCSIPLRPTYLLYVFLFLLFDANSGLTRLAAGIKMGREGKQLACVRAESNFKGMERKGCREDLAEWGNSAN